MGVAIRDILLDYKRPAEWDFLRGIAAVDAHNAIYQFLSIIRQPDGTPLQDESGRVTSHLSGIFFRGLNFIEKGILPIFIFDGTPPEFKATTIGARHQLRQEAGVRWQQALADGDHHEAYRQARSSSRIDRFIIDSSHELLSLLGIPVVEAPSEGEAQAAWMTQTGHARYTVSQDYDVLLFGAPLLVRNLTVSGRRRARGRAVVVNPEYLVLAEVLNGLSITREQLVDLGILIGTDFNPGVHGIGPKTALKIVQKGEVESTLAEKAPGFDPKPIREFFLSPPVTTNFNLSWSPPDAEGIRAMLVDGFSFSPERVNTALERLRGAAGQKTLDRWF